MKTYYPGSNLIVFGTIWNSNGEASFDSSHFLFEILADNGLNSNTTSNGNGPVFLNGNLNRCISY